MRRSRLARWFGSLLETQDEEISCSECLDRIPAYVDAELTGEGGPGQDPQLVQHLGQCRVCNEEYQVLSELAAKEARA